MAITQTGSTLQIGMTDNQRTGTVSSSITVPSDAELILVGISGYYGNDDSYTAMTFTKGGVDTAMVRVDPGGGDGTNISWQGALFFLNAPDTGSSKTLKWAWTEFRATAFDPVWNVSITFWKGVDPAAPVRDGDGEQATAAPVTTPTLNAVSGDLIVAWCSFYGPDADGSGQIDSWSNLSELVEIPHHQNAEGAWATGIASGDTTVAALTASNSTNLALSAVVLKPVSGGGAVVAPVTGVEASGAAGRARAVQPGEVYVDLDANFEASGAVGNVSVALTPAGFSLAPELLYHVTAVLGGSDIVTLDTSVSAVDEFLNDYGAWYEAGEAWVAVTGVEAVASVGSVTVIAEGEVEPPVTPIVGAGGGTIPKKQLRRAVRELLKREEKRKGKKRPKVLAREILEVIEAKGLGVQEKRIAIRLIGEALRLELPSLFYSQPLIRDKGEIARAILFIVEQAMQRLLDEEEDEEAALLLLSAA